MNWIPRSKAVTSFIHRWWLLPFLGVFNGAKTCQKAGNGSDAAPGLSQGWSEGPAEWSIRFCWWKFWWHPIPIRHGLLVVVYVGLYRFTLVYSAFILVYGINCRPYEWNASLLLVVWFVLIGQKAIGSWHICSRQETSKTPAVSSREAIEARGVGGSSSHPTSTTVFHQRLDRFSWISNGF